MRSDGDKDWKPADTFLKVFGVGVAVGAGAFLAGQSIATAQTPHVDTTNTLSSTLEEFNLPVENMANNEVVAIESVGGFADTIGKEIGEFFVGLFEGFFGGNDGDSTGDIDI